jgi:hypothetical protein
MSEKIEWKGSLNAIQPRIRLTRSFDEVSHSYLGYLLRVTGRIDGNEKEFLLGIGKVTQAKFQFRAGDLVSGMAVPVNDSRIEIAEFYKVSKLKLIERREVGNENGPPWTGVPLELSVYRERGHRRLSSRTYSSQCKKCLWGCCMAVEIIIDHWNPDQKKYRQETFCYGPLSCRLYKAGPTRKEGTEDTS